MKYEIEIEIEIEIESTADRNDGLYEDTSMRAWAWCCRRDNRIGTGRPGRPVLGIPRRDMIVLGIPRRDMIEGR